MAAAALCRFLNISSFLLLVLASLVCSLSFNLSHISSEDTNLGIKFDGEAYISGQGIQVTPNERNQKMDSKAGRATYAQPLHLWDNATRELADFTTHFTFNIDSDGGTEFGDGLAFFLADFTAKFNEASTAGAGLGLVDARLITSPEPFVAVVFDTFSNDMNIPMTNVSINVNSMRTSVKSTAWLNNITNGVDNDASITYSASSQILQVVFTGFWDDYDQTSSLSCLVDLRDYLPELVHIGFSAATGSNFEKHTVTSWQFDSTPLRSDNVSMWPAASSAQNQGKKHNIGVGVVILLALLALAICSCFKKRWAAKGTQEVQQSGYRAQTNNSPEERKLGEGGSGRTVENDDNQIALGREMGYSDRSIAMDSEFEQAGGPKKFSYIELEIATNNFSEKLGEGGFGGVYKGMLRDKEVAVKRVSSQSQQGVNEYAAEVNIISRLRQRNLVPLHGWCHERGELLLVYEYMPGGSLDSYLFKGKSHLNWNVRYKIAQGLAAALSYLHGDYEQCVLHRDIKCSNVLLDSSSNARLGDFGLASLLLEAADSKLGKNFVKQEMEKLMIAGLWCAHPDSKARPNMNEVVNHLKFQLPLQNPPSKMPMPAYPFSPNNMQFEQHSNSRYNSCPSGFAPPNTTEAQAS
nr:L-type lectin-domain containing receptor kinase IX.1-like [Ipomoea batatas]GMD75753.1 L-type lectin-domain containing receptor kinase IX.1-like [Ipomoea batatas]GME21817.1 L-type lectin-domain containing receptor kinase IX.1-like [Ipomoea batatas]